MTPYTIEEVKRVLETQSMDIYHRDLMKWLVSEVERLKKEIENDLLDDKM